MCGRREAGSAGTVRSKRGLYTLVSFAPASHCPASRSNNSAKEVQNIRVLYRMLQLAQSLQFQALSPTTHRHRRSQRDTARMKHTSPPSTATDTNEFELGTNTCVAVACCTPCRLCLAPVSGKCRTDHLLFRLHAMPWRTAYGKPAGWFRCCSPLAFLCTRATLALFWLGIFVWSLADSCPDETDESVCARATWLPMGGLSWP